MKIVRKRDGAIWVGGKPTGITVTFDSADRTWSAYAANDAWLFDGRTQWHVMNAITTMVEAFGAPRALLKRARDEMWDWQYVLCGEREGLDELCSEMDVALGNAPVIPWQK